MMIRSILFMVAAAGPLAAEAPPAGLPDSLRLAALIEEAVRADPRQRLVALHASESALKDRNFKAAYLPSISAVGQAQYNSEVFTLPFSLPAGQQVPKVRRDTYDASLRVEQAVYDPAVSLKRAVEQAALAASQAEVAVSLYAIRSEVETAFFTAATLEQRRTELLTTIDGLQGRLTEAASRFRAGTALAGDTAMITATILARRQDLLQVEADRHAALGRLGILLGHPVDDSSIMTLPDYVSAADAIRHSMDTATARPEFAHFAALRQQLARQAALEGAGLKPRLSLFGRLGYGLPGPNPLSDSFNTYWSVGAQVSWAPFDWGSTTRRRQALDIEREIVVVNETAFARDLRLSIQSDLATLDRLTATLAMDDQIVTLREQTEHEARVRLAEGAITTAEYVDRNTELLNARLDRAQHRVELARSQAELLTLLGAETR